MEPAPVIVGYFPNMLPSLLLLTFKILLWLGIVLWLIDIGRGLINTADGGRYLQEYFLGEIRRLALFTGAIVLAVIITPYDYKRQPYYMNSIIVDQE